jgi:NADH-quinone oxidoreductase subunit G
MLIDDASAIDGEPYLAATARRPVIALSPDLAAEIDVAAGDPVTIRGSGAGLVTWPAQIEQMPQRTVWLPASSGGVRLGRDVGVGHGSVVQIEKGVGP